MVSSIKPRTNYEDDTTKHLFRTLLASRILSHYRKNRYSDKRKLSVRKKISHIFEYSNVCFILNVASSILFPLRTLYKQSYCVVIRDH